VHYENLKMLYNSFVEKDRGYPEKFLNFALRTLGWSRDIELPPYCQKCHSIDLDVLSSRHGGYLLVLF
jgi:hypothetical protein